MKYCNRHKKFLTENELHHHKCFYKEKRKNLKKVCTNLREQ
jgi:hypothetical protein